MAKSRVFWLSGIAASLVCIVGVASSAQTPRLTQVSSSSSLDDLLAEIRGLRAEIRQAAGASIRTQLLVARLEVQEQRVNAVARQLADVQGPLATIRQDVASKQAFIRQWEDAGARSADPAEQRSVQHLMYQYRMDIEQLQEQERDLRGRESSLFATLTAEQNRWGQFNDRLDALERSLPAAGTR
jgi:chromosome segregation ATPase